MAASVGDTDSVGGDTEFHGHGCEGAVGRDGFAGGSEEEVGGTESDGEVCDVWEDERGDYEGAG